MPLLAQLRTDMKEAMKAGDKARLATIRLLLSDLKNVVIDKQGDLTSEEELSFLSTQAKRRRESAGAYREGGRIELAEQEEAELVVINTYLPQQLTVDEAREVIRSVIAEVGAESKRDMGRVMGKVMPKMRGVFPGGDAKKLVDELLS